MKWERKMFELIAWENKTEEVYIRKTLTIYNKPKIDMVIKSKRLQWLGHIEENSVAGVTVQKKERKTQANIEGSCTGKPKREGSNLLKKQNQRQKGREKNY